MGEAIRIWVDDRESRSSDLGRRLSEVEGVSVVVKRLRTGDYLIEGKVVLERKRVRDFLESLKEGRLFAQASMHILTGIPKVGPTRARRMLEHFGSIEAIVTATPEVLAAVEGIGRRTAQHIHWAVHESPEPYRA